MNRSERSSSSLPEGYKVCPKTGRVFKAGGKGSWLAWGFSVMGFLSLMWFLVRVIPKPSRAAYPCQRAAFPVASSFVVWLTSLLGLNFAWRKFLRRDTRMWQACLWCAAALAMGAFMVANLPTWRAWAADPNNPIGTAKGVFPGRVVWVHAPEATSWAGYDSSEHWYESTHTDQAKVDGMMSKAVRAAGGGGSIAAAWTNIFKNYNQTHGRGSIGYQAGEKIAIKINLATCWGKDPDKYVNVTNTYEKRNIVDANWMNTIDNSPQMLHSLLQHLINVVGVEQTNIYLGDPSGNLPKFMWDRLHADFPSVNYFDNYGGNGGSQPRLKVQLSSVPFNWSTNVTNWTATGGSWSPWHTTNGVGKLQDRVPQPFAEATYIINFAVLKGHSTGITVCGKNWYGALKRLPNQWYADGANQTGYSNYIHLHYSTPRPKSGGYAGLGNYRAIVDLMGHPELGGKTVLCLVDGLFGGYYSDSKPLLKWQAAPFNDDWPSSLFVSQDPVAIDSVCYDFLMNEWPNIVNYGTQTPGIGDDLGGGAEDYLHEAALANDPPSHSFYNPGTNDNPARLGSLGVHEHWNNATDKKYSRNLNPAAGQGIELVALSTATDLRAITQSPSATNACVGSTVKFSVVATGEGTLTYQWQTNGANISDNSHYAGCTGNTLWITNVSSSDAVNYGCVVTDVLGSTTSSAAALTLRAATQITQHPSATNVCAGATATFSVVATGEGTITYQWQKNQTNISNGGHYSGVTTATLTITGADTNDATNYRCVATAGCGDSTSFQGALTLRPATAITQQPVAQTVCFGANASFTVAATGEGTFGYQWQTNGVNISNNSHYSGCTTATLWVTNVQSADAVNYRCVVNGGCGSATSSNALLSCGTTYTAQRRTDTITVDGNLSEASWSNAVSTEVFTLWDGSPAPAELEMSAKMVWDDQYLYIGFSANDPDVFATYTGRDVRCWDQDNFEVFVTVPGTTGYVEVECGPTGLAFWDGYWTNVYNPPNASNYTMTGLQISGQVSGTLNDPTDTDTGFTCEIRLPFSDIYQVSGGHPTNGTQLRVNMNRIDWDTPVPLVPPVTNGAAGSRTYHSWSPMCGSTPNFHQPDKFGTVTFSTNLVSHTAPEFTQHPVATNVCAGATVTFGITATGEGTLTYQWQTNVVNISNNGHYGGCTSSTLWVTNVTSSDAVNYRCVVTDGFGGSSTSSPAALTLKSATEFTQMPTAHNVAAGSNTTFSVEATGAGTLTYQWQTNEVNISNNGHYSGCTTATLWVTNVTGSDAVNYRCVVTGDCGSLPSANALLSIGDNQLVQEYTVNRVIPDGSLIGVHDTRNLSTAIHSVTNVKVRLKISGTYNGDLYCYVTHESGYSVLLNRVGRTATKAFGYGDPGLDVTFDDNATNDVHTYRVALNGNPDNPLGTSLTGSWMPDGRTTRPDQVLDTDTRPAKLDAFEGMDPNGEWTIYVGDTIGGDSHTLVSWGLEVTGFAPPVANPDTYSRVSGVPLKIKVADLLANDTGEGIAFAGLTLTSTNGVLLTTNATTIFYSNPNNVNDQITYHLRDRYGNLAEGLILIQIAGSANSSLTVVRLQTGVPGPNTNTLTLAGIPSYQYVVQFATNGTGNPWFNLSTNTAGANGLWTVQDPTATNVQRFYRVSMR